MTPVPPARLDERKRAALRRVWQEARPVRPDDPVDRYLRRRGLALAEVPRAIRYHPRLRYRHEDGQDTAHPAMVALVTAPDSQAVSLHRTYLTPDGHKADVPSPKKLMPPAVPGATRGAAIRLYQAIDTLAVAEGIETALAVHLTTGKPVWATICASNMAMLALPDTMRTLIIGADHDAPGLKAAKALARRMLAEGRRIEILTPGTPGADWADSLEVAHA